MLTLCAGLCGDAHAAARLTSGNELAAVTFDSSPDGMELAASVGLLEDKSRQLGLEQVRTSRMPWSHRRIIAPGFSHSVFWLQLRLTNPSTRSQRLVLDLNQPLQDYVHWYVTDHASGALLLDMASGDRVPFAQRPLLTRGLALPLNLAGGAALDVFVRLDTYDGLYESIDPLLYAVDDFERTETSAVLLHGLYFGCLIALTLYNLLIWMSSREPGFGLYVIFSASFLVWSVTYRGFGFEFLWPNSPVFNNQLLPVAASLSFAGFSGFCARLFRLSIDMPTWQSRTLTTFIWLDLLAIPIALSDRYALAWIWVIPVGLANLAVMNWVGLSLWRRRVRAAQLLAISLFPMGAGAFVTLLQLAGLAPHHRQFDALWEVSSAFQMLVLALGMADSFNQIKKRMLATERETHAVQTRLAARLEEQVRERTMDLSMANRRLEELSMTDGLTGAFNRRCFDQRCQDMLTARRRVASPIAFCMMDIDHFKSFNDHYGHQQGDRVLCAVVDAIRHKLRRQDDALFRIGGEEFGVLFAPLSAGAAIEFCDELRVAVRDLGIAHEGSAALVVTASFGVDFQDGDSLRTLTTSQLYANADRALYAAKSRGRDRVVLGADA